MTPFYKLSNNLGTGYLASGIVPQHYVNESDSLPLKNRSSLDDSWIQQTLTIVEGGKSLEKRGAGKRSSLSMFRIMIAIKLQQANQWILHINN
ncbi:hypothetical protein GCM10022216_00650 [Sphingobacterium kyonggiense]|uniref:Uncharacterized protein n=1 Tax=Sphingobacterium kyonggiense TaxID=714075 RepID=A0ABP7Y5E3_9SPHI